MSKPTLLVITFIGLAVLGVVAAIAVRTVMGRTVVGVPSGSATPNNMTQDLTASTQTASKSVLDFKADTIEGKSMELSTLKGKVVLIVNTASKCGFTRQFAGLEELHKKYADKGLVVIGFPSNDFGGQDPGTDDQIASYCQTNYGVTFQMMSKIVVKGDTKHPVYQFLTSKESNGEFAGEIGWNFTKFLVDKNGVVFSRFASSAKPTDETVSNAIEAAIAK